MFPILNLQWHDDTYSKGLSGLIRDFVGRKNELPPQDPKEWYDEFARLNDEFAPWRVWLSTRKPGVPACPA